jgi:hypothetical protein
MPRCLAYVRPGNSKHAWVRCVRQAAAGSQFCRSHENAINGAVLGLWVNGFPERVGIHAGTGNKDKTKPKNKK